MACRWQGTLGQNFWNKTIYHWRDFVNLNVSAFYFSDSGQFFLVLVTSHFGGMSAFFGLEIPTTGLSDMWHYYYYYYYYYYYHHY